MLLIPCPACSPWAAVRQAAGDDRGFRRRRRYGAAFRRVHDRVERPASRAVRNALLSILRLVTDRIRDGATQVDDLFRREEFAPLARVLRRQLQNGVAAGISLQADQAAAVRERKASQAASWWNAIWQDAGAPPSIFVELSPSLQRSVEEWLETRAVGVWGTVAETTRKTLIRAVSDGLKDGLSMNRLAEAVGKRLDHYAGWQAMRVARTEMTGSLNYGQQIERQNLDIPGKEWVSTIDSLNRGANPTSAFDHLAPDGQVVLNDDAFVVSGERLMFPGDSALGASAGNLINCRCGAVAAWPEEPLSRPARTVESPGRRSDRAGTLHPTSLKTEAVGPVSVEFDRAMRDGMRSIPKDVRKLLKKAGVEIRTGELITVIDPELEGYVLEGAAPDEYEGLYDSERKRMLIPEFVVDSAGVKVKIGDVASNVRHEAGHAFDHAFKRRKSDPRLSATEAFRKAVNKDLGDVSMITDQSVRQEVENQLSLLTGNPDTKYAEVAAHCFAVIHGGGGISGMDEIARAYLTRSIREIQRAVGRVK